MIITNRIVIQGTTVRLYGHRKDAINAAAQLTRSTQTQYRAVTAPPHVGWLVENAASKELRDIDGILPGIVASILTPVS